MQALNRVRLVVRRFVDPFIHPENGSAAHGLIEAARMAGNRLHGFCERLRAGVQESERQHERTRREAIRIERRATRRALLLLLRQLNPEQRKEFRERRFFHVVGGGSGDRYRIRVDVIANIDVLRKDGIVRHRLCARPAEDVPVYDVMAAQLLHLQDAATEQAFLQRANVQSTLPEDQVCFRTHWGA